MACAKQQAVEKDEPLDISQAERIFSFPGGPPQQANLAEVLIEVNGEPIRRRDIRNEALKLLSTQPLKQMKPEEIKLLTRKAEAAAAETLIVRAMVLKQAESDRIDIADEAVDAELEKIKQQLPEGTTLADQLEKLNASEAAFRLSIREQLLFQKAISGPADAVAAPTDEELQADYDKNKDKMVRPATIVLDHIFLQVNPPTDETTRTRKTEELNDYRKQIAKDAAMFPKLATAWSDCPLSKNKKGHLGEVDPNALKAYYPGLEYDVLSLSSNTLSQVVNSQAGIHLFRGGKKTEAVQLVLEDVKEQRSRQLHAERKKAAIDAYLKGLREKATITFTNAAKQGESGTKEASPDAAPNPEPAP